MTNWDEWFKYDEESMRAWEAAKQTFTDPKVLEGWAFIIELNRISKAIKTKGRSGIDEKGPAEM